MRISDWSSDVCSSDLGVHVLACRNSAAVRFLSQAGGVQRGRGGGVVPAGGARGGGLGDRRLLLRSEEHTSELQSLMRISYAVFCLKKKKKSKKNSDQLRTQQQYI